MDPSEISAIMLAGMAWERAKGELRSILYLFRDEKKYNTFSACIETFVKEMEDHEYWAP